MPPKSALALTGSTRPGTTQHRAERPTRVGILVPWANTVVEDELPRLRPDAVVFHYARLVPPSETTALDAGFLDGMRAAVPAALASMRQLPLAGVLLACTSAGLTAPRHTIPDRTGSGLTAGSHTTDDSDVQRESGAGVVSAFDALTGALRRLGAGRIALATPYPRSITEREADAFAGAGITVTAHASLDLDDGYGTVAAADITALAAEIPASVLASADALVLSCTGWPTLDVIPELERRLRMPVVSSNLALAIHTAGLRDHHARTQPGRTGPAHTAEQHSGAHR